MIYKDNAIVTQRVNLSGIASTETRGNRIIGRMFTRRADQAVGARQLLMRCGGALLGVVFAGNVCAEAGVLAGKFSQETVQTALQAGRPEIVSGSVASRLDSKIGTQESKASIEHQAMLQVASLDDNYEMRGVSVGNSGAGTESVEGRAGVPYAVLLSLVALIGLVPVARRNGGL